MKASLFLKFFRLFISLLLPSAFLILVTTFSFSHVRKAALQLLSDSFCHEITETQLIIHLFTTADVTKYSLCGEKGPATKDSVVERKVTQ